MIQAIQQAMTVGLEKVGRLLCRGMASPQKFCYFPRFNTLDDWTTHYYRACWYLPYHPEACHGVWMPVEGEGLNLSALKKPEYFGAIPSPSAEHIKLQRGAQWLSMLKSGTILVWKIQGDGREEPPAVRWMRRLGKQICYVDLVRRRSGSGYFIEYLNYSKLLWNNLPAAAKERLIQDNKARFLAYVDTLKDLKEKPAYVFGNGPTLAHVENYSEFKGVRIACNTIVANRDLMEKIAPHFIATVDPESHFGPSRYADKFRRDLGLILDQGHCRAIVPLLWTIPVLTHFPEVADKVFALPTDPALTFDLAEDFHLPDCFGVLASAMLPVAATFSRDINLLGFDG